MTTAPVGRVHFPAVVRFGPAPCKSQEPDRTAARRPRLRSAAGRDPRRPRPAQRCLKRWIPLATVPEPIGALCGARRALSTLGALYATWLSQSRCPRGQRLPPSPSPGRALAFRGQERERAGVRVRLARALPDFEKATLYAGPFLSRAFFLC